MLLRPCAKLPSLGLKEAKDLVVAAPQEHQRITFPRKKRETIKKKFTDAGATVEIK